VTLRIKLKNSVVKDKAPVPGDLEVGELAINAHQDSPAAYIKDAAGAVRKLAGVGAIGATDATTSAKGVVQLADAAAVTAGTAGRVVDAAQLKANPPDATETIKGKVQLATAAEVTTGTNTTKAVTPAGLKVELDKKVEQAPIGTAAGTKQYLRQVVTAGTAPSLTATRSWVEAPSGLDFVETPVSLAYGGKTVGKTFTKGLLTATIPATVGYQFTVDTTAGGTEPANATFSIESVTFTGTIDVNWGDGNTQTGLAGTSHPHTYSAPGTYTVQVVVAKGTPWAPRRTSVGGSIAGYSPYIKSVDGIDSGFSFYLGANPVNAVWASSTHMTSFAAIDLSDYTNCTYAWKGCAKLTAFPSIHFNRATSFVSAWQNCAKLQDFPAGLFNRTGALVATAFTNSFTGCALTAASIENILVSLDANGATGVTLNMNAGTNAGKATWTAATNTAYTSLVTKGWTITNNP